MLKLASSVAIDLCSGLNSTTMSAPTTPLAGPPGEHVQSRNTNLPQDIFQDATVDDLRRHIWILTTALQGRELEDPTNYLHSGWPLPCNTIRIYQSRDRGRGMLWRTSTGRLIHLRRSNALSGRAGSGAGQMSCTQGLHTYALTLYRYSSSLQEYTPLIRTRSPPTNTAK